jgi:hypothetical protein
LMVTRAIRSRFSYITLDMDASSRLRAGGSYAAGGTL